MLGYNSVSGSLTLIEPRPDVGEVPRQQFMDPLDRMFCDTLQHLAQVVLGIEHVQLCGLGQRVDCCEAFSAPEARRLVERFEWHYTPKHGSWLDLAESELSVLSGQCLDRRIPDKKTLVEEVAAWENSRNKTHTKADWQFTTDNARVKLKRLYPSV